MAKKSKKKDAVVLKKEPQIDPKREAVRLQIWGVVYTSLGILLFVSLISNSVSPESNILGPWLGRSLALGLEVFIGKVTAFLLPPIVIYIGSKMFRGEELNIRNIIITIAIILEVSILSAVPALPFINSSTFDEFGNVLGYLILKFIVSPIFGTETFGPYFILTIAFILTIVGFLQVDLLSLWEIITSKLSSYLEKQKEVSRAKKIQREELKAQKRVEKEEKRKEKESKQNNSFTIEENEIHENLPVEELATHLDKIDDKDIEEHQESTQEPQSITEENVEDTFVLPNINTYDGDSLEEVVSDTDEDNEDDSSIADASFIAPDLTKDVGDDSHLATVSSELIEELPKQKPYKLPSIEILENPPQRNGDVDRVWIEEKSIRLIKTLEEFKLKGCRVVNVNSGPVVTQFEIELAPGIQVKKIVNLQDDIALKVGGKAIRIQAPIPGKAYVGIEIPNDNREIVYFKDILTSPAFKNSKAKLPVIVGKSISGKPLVEDVSKMPHILIAGQTGAGKSVGINSFIATLLFSKTPEELRLIMIDPKKVEMACYEGIPHLMSPVVTEPEKAVAALQWGVKEMEYRYRLLAKVGAKNIESFNKKVENGTLEKFVNEEKIEPSENNKLPFVVIIVDELADLMMTASKDVEALVQRIAQLARAVGIHLIVATQRPSVDIITGPIKANLTSRISFRTIQSQDSRTILGSIGAEKLLGMGDMLYLKNGAPSIERYHGAFISEEDVENLVEEINKQNYAVGQIEFKVEEKDDKSSKGNSVPSGEIDDRDEHFEEAGRLIMANGVASTSMIQRRLKLGYNRAGRIMDQLEEAGVVGPAQGGKPREILITKEAFEEMLELM